MRFYQNVDIDGVEFEDKNRATSNFWNEGKWDNFVLPLLPDRRETFIELGCNAGLFLKMAKDAGFKRVIGVDSSGRRIKQAEAYRSKNGYDYQLLNKTVGQDLDIEDLPMADMVLLSNFHYYLPVHTFSKLVNDLRMKTNYVIIVSAKARVAGHCADNYINSVRGYFSDWTEIGSIQGIDATDDSAPREEMYGLLFKSDLVEYDVEECIERWKRETELRTRGRRKEFPHVLIPFARRVISGESIDDNNGFYKYWVSRSGSEEFAKDFVEYKKQLFIDIKENGIKTPIYADRKGRVFDGIHRITVAHVLGIKSVLCKII